MIALDTNMLVYAHRRRTPQHRAARLAVERAAADARGWGIATPALAEFWAIATHPASEGRPSTGREAAEFVRALVDAGAHLWQSGPGFGQRLLQLAIDREVTGPRVFDLQIALVAFEGGATELWTHDRRFGGVPGLAIVDPLA